MSLRSIYGVCTIMACAILSALPAAAAAQPAGNSAVLTTGLHHATLPQAGGPTINYAISIPENYSRATPVPLILALHFGVGGAGAAGAGASVLQILVGPGLAELGAIIVAPDSTGGNWSSPENEKGVNALLDMVVSRYAIDKNRIAVTGYSMGGAGAWFFAEKFPQRFSAAIPIAAGLRPPPPAGGFPFWRFIPATIRSHLLSRPPHESPNFKDWV
jgi:predicted peptidase